MSIYQSSTPSSNPASIIRQIGSPADPGTRAGIADFDPEQTGVPFERLENGRIREWPRPVPFLGRVYFDMAPDDSG